MQNDRKYLLGINVNMVTATIALEWILDKISRYEEKRPSRFVTAIDSSFLIEINGWRPSHTRNHEVADVLHKATLVLCGTSQLQRLGNSFESPFRECVPIASLLIPLAMAMAQKGYSIYILSSHDADLKALMSSLQQAVPDLKIAGSSIAHINTKGDKLLEAPDRDALLIEQINSAKPSVLLLNLGSPTEELWFARISSQLYVPITIGMGNKNVEKSWKDLPQLLYMAVPAILYHRFSKLMYNLFYRHSAAFQQESRTRLFVAATRTIIVLELPTLVDLSPYDVDSGEIDQIFAHDHLVIDFSHVRHISTQGISFLTTLWQRAIHADKAFSGLGINGDIQLLLRLHRAWECVGIHQFRDMRELLISRQHAHHNFLYIALEQNELHVTASFLGQLDNTQDYEQLLQQLHPILKERNCTLDLSYCTTVESRGCSFLLTLQKNLRSQGKRLYLYNLNANLKEELRRTGLLPLMTLQSTHPHHTKSPYGGAKKQR